MSRLQGIGVLACAILVWFIPLPTRAVPVKWTLEDVTFQTFEGTSTPHIDHPAGWFIYDVDIFQGDSIIDWDITYFSDGTRPLRPNVCPPTCGIKNAGVTPGPDFDNFVFSGAIGTPQASDFLFFSVPTLTNEGGRVPMLDGFFESDLTTRGFFIGGFLVGDSAAIPEASTVVYLIAVLMALYRVRSRRSDVNVA